MSTAPTLSDMSDADDTSSDELVREQAPARLVLGEEHLREYWRTHVLPTPKGRVLPLAIFELGTLADVVLEQLEARDPIWERVTNRVLLPSGVMVHWDLGRRQVLFEMVDHLGRYIRGASEVSLGNGQHGWCQPLLITQAPGGLTVPIAIVPGEDGIEIRSLIAPVDVHRLRALRKRR